MEHLSYGLRLAAFCTTALLLAEPARPQTFDARESPISFKVKDKGWDEHGLISVRDHQATIRWEWSVLNAQGAYDPYTEVTATLPFDRPGTVVKLDRHFYLASGYNQRQSKGYVVKILLDRGEPRRIYWNSRSNASWLATPFCARPLN